MPNSISTQIRDALQQKSSDAVIRDVKHAVARELELLDPRIAIRSTDYFNHTFIPDFVLGFGGSAERDVYLRFDVNAPSLKRDLESLHSDSPAFIGIAGDANGDGDMAQSVDNYDNVLLSSASALEPISAERSRDPITQMVKTSLLQGGRGYLMGTSARKITDVVHNADSELANLDGASVGSSLRSLEQTFTSPYFSRMQKVMQVLWSSRGGSIENFPGKARKGPLSISELSEVLPFILNLEEIENLQFWRELGENLNLRVLEEIHFLPSGANLDNLINVNLDRVKAKSMTLDRSDITLFDDQDAGFRWEVSESVLSLRTVDFSLCFVNDRRKISRRSSDLGSTPRWSEIAGRLEHFSIEGISFTAPSSKLMIQSSTTVGLTASTDMDALNSALGDLARVNSIQLRIPELRNLLEINFDRSLVDATDAPVSPHLLARYGLDLLYQASPEVLEALKSFTSWDSQLPWWPDYDSEETE